MKYQLAIFDLDGTILDTLEDLWTSGCYALRSNGLPERTIDEVRSFVGNGIRNYMRRAVPEGSSEELLDRVHADFTAHYAEHCADHTQPYAGIPELLTALRSAGMKTAVVSNKADYGVQTLIGDYFPGMFDHAVGEREGVRRKPAPDAVLTVLDALSVPREQAVYIGDSDVDIETARNAGMPCISVDWGFRSTKFLIDHGAKLIVSTPSELQSFLLQK